MKNIYFTILITLTVCCKKGNQSNKIINQFEKLISEKVYTLDENGNKEKLTLIIEGSKLYTSDESGNKIEFLLEKVGNKVFEIKHKVINNKIKSERGRALYIFEGNKYWEIDKKTNKKSRLIFERKGNIIYQNENGEFKKILMID